MSGSLFKSFSVLAPVRVDDAIGGGTVTYQVQTLLDGKTTVRGELYGQISFRTDREVLFAGKLRADRFVRIQFPVRSIGFPITADMRIRDINDGQDYEVVENDTADEDYVMLCRATQPNSVSP